jgi:hypothetical protein
MGSQLVQRHQRIHVAPPWTGSNGILAFGCGDTVGPRVGIAWGGRTLGGGSARYGVPPPDNVRGEPEPGASRMYGSAPAPPRP